MHVAGRPVRALFAAGLAILAGLSAATLSGQVVAVQSGQPPPATAQAAPEPPKGTGILIGQVVDAGTKRGIPGALVGISSSFGITTQTGVMLNGQVVVASGPGAQPSGPNDAPRQLLTDSSGRFMFRNLTAGRYSIRVTASPYLESAYGASRAGAIAQTVELTRDDEKRDGIVIRMWKGASISGTVVDEAGEPAIGVGIRAFRRTVVGGRTRLQAFLSASTDDRGAYRITSLTPGDYFVGIITTSTTMPASTSDALTQAMYSGQSLTTSDVYRELMTSGTAIMNMTLGGPGGSYRVGDFNFQTGGIMQRTGSGPPAPGADGRVLTYPSTFYPGVGVIAQATPITVASGEDRTRIDLQLKLLPSVRVSGTVTSPDGPLRNISLRLLPAGADDFATDTQMEAATSVTDANGAFTFLGVTPGSYTLKVLRIPRATPVATRGAPSPMVEVTGPGGMVMGMSMAPTPPGVPPPPPPLPTDLTLWATTSVTVDDSDVGGLVVALQPGVRLSGRIVFDGEAEKPTLVQVQQTAVTVSPVSTTSPVGAVARRVESDGTFATNGYPPGRYLVSSSPGPGMLHWRFKSATLGGRIVSDEGLDLQSEDVAGLVITFTDRLGEISGTVINDRGAPDQTGSVVVIPADSTAWKQGIVNTRRVRSVRLSTKGAFTFADLPPGAYYVAAIADDLPDNWQLTATLEAITRIATRVVVADGAKISQTLTSRPLR